MTLQATRTRDKGHLTVYTKDTKALCTASSKRPATTNKMPTKYSKELWLRIINNKQQFNPEYKFTTWAYTIANRLLIDWLRKNAKNVNANLTEDLTEEPADTPLNAPDNDLERKRMAKQLTEAITTLPDQQRMTFVMKHESGLSLSEVATATEQPLERIKSQYRYAIKKLKLTLEHWR